ncbi:MAG: diacylglycerol/lipid kinase family protein [Aridibacter sp.]
MSETTRKFLDLDGSPNLPIVIVNPNSAGGSTRNRWSQIASDLRSHFGAYRVALTKRQGDGTELAKKFIESGRKFIIACGGDGTINEVANGILQTGEDVELGIIPAGTGGDFRRSLGISSSPREAAKELKTGVTKLIDVGRITFFNHENMEVSRYFLNVASFGLSASINSRVKQKGEFQWIPSEVIRGKTKFALSTLQEILDTEFKTIRVSIDGKEEKTLNTINFCVCNARFFGGGMKIAPDAKLNDGFFDLVNIGDINTARILLNGYKLYNGSHLALPEVKSTLVKKIEVRAFDENAIINIETDGELPGKLPATFEIVPKILKVRVPKK